jgi:hypothetical protein
MARWLSRWLASRFGCAEVRAQEAELLRKWEFAQANDFELVEADPFKDEMQAAFDLADTSPAEGFARLLDLANRGSIHSMHKVGWCYATGSGVTEDKDRAGAWYRRAFESGSDRGLLEYGAYLVWRDRIEEATKVYEAGWERGFVPAIYRLIRLHLRPTLPLEDRLAWMPSLEWAARRWSPCCSLPSHEVPLAWMVRRPRHSARPQTGVRRRRSHP